MFTDTNNYSSTYREFTPIRTSFAHGTDDSDGDYMYETNMGLKLVMSYGDALDIVEAFKRGPLGVAAITYLMKSLAIKRQLAKIDAEELREDLTTYGGLPEWACVRPEDNLVQFCYDAASYIVNRHSNDDYFD